nr:protein kinase [Kofleriaceae bacterium]
MTQSLHVDADDGNDADDSAEYSEDPSQSLALGTREARDSHTKIESPAAQRRTPPPPEPEPGQPRKSSGVSSSSRRKQSATRSDDPKDYLGHTLGAYRVDELLGKGGMGYVFRAEHVKLGRHVALKVLRADYARRKDAVARFFQEARAVVRIRHRNIVDVTDLVELDDGTTFIIMELLAGVSLGKWARSGIDLPRALAVLVQICDGLDAAHAVGIIHRDLKPDNVIVVPTSDGAELVKLLDFGVAKLVNRDDEDVGFQTAAGSVIGTPAYMSPEQAGGMSIDQRSDIYSLGAIMYELFCGQPMFRGRSFGEYVRKHLTELPTPPRQTEGGRELDERLEAVILKALEKEPAQRYSTIVELRDALLHMLGGIETLQSGMYSQVHSASVVRVTPLPSGHYEPGAIPTPTPASLQAMSSIQSLPGLPPQQPPVPLPGLPPPMHMAPMQVPMQPAMQTHISSQMHPSSVVQYGTHASQVEPPSSTPWYVWMVGGLIAVGLGVGGAWYVTREPAPPAVTSHKVTMQPQPSVAPAQPEAAPAQPQVVEVRFDSLPGAGVFADGHSAELCHTPCSFDVDLKDGGPTDKRTFVVRADGYEDKQVEVAVGDATATRDFHVTLTQLEPKTPAVPLTSTPPVTPPHGAIHKGGAQPKAPATPETRPETKPETKPVTKPGTPKVPDATETLDPFKTP